MEGMVRSSAGADSRLLGNQGWLIDGRRFLAWSLCLILSMFVGDVAATRYVYDANGRLIAVTNDADESARYVHDVMGNIVRVDRLAAGELALFTFSPDRGVSGTAVRVKGHAFSADPANNVVRFGGVIAGVSSASSSELVALVPAGAVTGPISVTVGTQSVSSSKDFIVDESALAPRIDSLSPLVANAGTNVTVTGQSLYPMIGQTTVLVGTRAGALNAAQDNQLSFAVPPAAGSAKVSVSTPYGMAVSAQDLVVLPDAVSAANLASSSRVNLDGAPAVFSTSTTGQQVALLVDAVAGEYLDAQFSNISVASLAYTLYDPANAQVVSGTVTPTTPTLLLPRAARAGTYLLILKPVQGPATWNLAIERSKPIAIDGSPIKVANAAPGQKKRFVFHATQLQRLGMGASDLVISSGTYVNFNVYGPSGTSLTSGSYSKSSGGDQLNLSIAATGVHTLVVSPQSGGQTMALDLVLSNDLAAVLPRESQIDVALPRRGQNARFTFTAQVGETLALQAYGQLTAPTDKSVYYSVYRPDGTLLTSKTFAAYGTMNLPTLPLSGDYLVFVDPVSGAALNSKLRLTAGVDSGMQPNGTIGSFVTTTPGQPIYATFQATAGQTLGIGLSELQLSSGSYVGVAVLGPTGTQLDNDTYYKSYGGSQFNLTIATSGTYSVVVTPQNDTQTLQLNLTVSEDLRAVLPREMPLDMALPRHGQNARLFFEAQAGESLALQVAGQVTDPASKGVYYRAYRPDGTLLVSRSTTGFGTLNLPTLPVTGTYQIFVDAGYGETVTARLVLTDGRGSGAQVDGQTGQFATTYAGQPVYLTFEAVAGQKLGVGFSDLAISSGSYVSAALYDPTGAQLDSTTYYLSYGTEQFNLTAKTTGTYSVIVTPQAATQTIRLNITLSEDVRASLQREVPLALSLPRYGQNGRLTFTASAGDSLAVQLNGQATLPASRSLYYYIYKPDGTLLDTKSLTSVYGTLNLATLPMGGEYVIVVDPNRGESAQVNMKLTAGQAQLPVDGATQSVSNTAAGQPVYLTFQAQAGQKLGLGLSDLTLSTGTYVSVNVYGPTGASVASGAYYKSYGGEQLNLPIKTTGTYAVVLTPPSATQIFQLKAWLSQDLDGTLERDTAKEVSINRTGQNARLKFSAQAGDNLGLLVSTQSTLPAGKAVVYRVYTPSASLLDTLTVSSASYGALNLPALPSTGDYEILVDADHGETLSTRLTLSTGMASVPANHTGVMIASAITGEPVYFLLPATGGLPSGFGISDVANSGTQFNVNVYRPDGASSSSGTCRVVDLGCEFDMEPAADSYYAVIVMPQSATQRLIFRATFTHDKQQEVVNNQLIGVPTQFPGENGSVFFDAVAGDVVNLLIGGYSTLPEGKTTNFQLFKPDGSKLAVPSTKVGDTTLSLGTMPVTGRYRIRVDPSFIGELSVDITLQVQR